MSDTVRLAKRTGLLYVVAGITAPFSLIYVPRTLIVPGDAAATAERLGASATLLRAGVASELLVATLFLFVALALHRLLRAVNERHALAMAVLLIASVPISYVNVLNSLAAWTLASAPSGLVALDPQTRAALAYLFLRLHGQGLLLAAIFWGLWLFPFGLLVMRSGFLPRALGALLIVAGVGYLLGSLTPLFAPSLAPAVAPVAMLLETGELPIVLWLMIRGARPEPSAA